MTRSATALVRASAVIPGGLTSAARVGVQPEPLFVDHADGCRLVDVDGRTSIDFGLANGPLLLGHRPEHVLDAVRAQLARGVMFGAQHELEAEVAELLVELVPCAQRALFSSTGSEAVHAALRLARAVTGRSLVVRFEGHYHGWLGDIAFAGPGAPAASESAQSPLPATALTAGMLPAQQLAVLRWNDRTGLERLFAERGADVAAVILEPVPLAGLIAPRPDFLQAVRDLTSANGAVLIFDEVVTGFRLGAAGAQGVLGVQPDLAVLGKAIAAGFPVSAVVGRADLLDAAGDGRMAHMGTFNGHPPSMAAAAAALKAYRDPALHEALHARTAQLADGLVAAAQDDGIELRVPRVGALAAVLPVAPDIEIRDYGDLRHVDRAWTAALARELLVRGVFMPPRGTLMLSTAHGADDVAEALDAARTALAEARA